VLVVGLTGGIGSGKSTVAELFAARGVPVLDADRIAREVVAPGTSGLDEVVATFGAGVLDAEGGLHRRRLRERIFSNSRARQRLEAIIHPRVRAEMCRRLDRLRADYAILIIPLLVERGQQDLVDRVLVVDLPETLQIRRAAARDDVDTAAVERIMEAQCRREQRLRAADDIIDNSGGPDRLIAQVDRLHQHYLGLAASWLQPTRH
jgi:dephospho-CoA kinase